MPARPLTPRTAGVLIFLLIVLTGLSVYRLQCAGPAGPYVAFSGRTMGTTYDIKVADADLSPDGMREVGAAIDARLERVNEDLVHERDVLLVAIAEHVEELGGEGNDGTALADSLGQIVRLLNGRDVDAGLSLVGVAGQVEALVWLLRNATTCDDMEKAELYFARLDFSEGESTEGAG